MALLSNGQPSGNRARGAVARYLKYALGEIVLVVVGILIALQINDWYQDRLDRRSEREYLLSMMRDLTEDIRELSTAQQQSRDVMTYFHELEDSHKRLFDLTLSKQALEFIEQDYLNMLQPLEVFEPLVPRGNYLANDDPIVVADYYDDMLYYRTALNILTLMYRRQLHLAESLSTLIETQYGIPNEIGAR